MADVRTHIGRSHAVSRRAGHSRPGQRHVDAGRRHLLADDRQGADPDAGGVAGSGDAYRQTLCTQPR